VALATEIAKNIIAAAPGGKLVVAAKRRRVQLVADSSTPEYVRRNFNDQIARISRYRPISGRMLDIGPGANLGLAALYLKAGCDKAYAIDIENWLRDDTSTLYGELGVSDFVGQVDYRYPVSIETADFPDDFFDVIVSAAMLHMVLDADRAVANICRMLKPGCFSVHALGMTDRWTRDPLAFLRYSDLAWKIATSHRPGQPNRWRLSDWTDAFERHGAPLVEVHATQIVELTESDRASFAPRFREKTLPDLRVAAARIVAQKPA
jgi:SAM-dependent methyltransferase